MGDGYLRRLLVVGATAVLRMARQRGGGAWVMGLLERKRPKAAAVALANNTARIAWVLMSRKETYAPATIEEIGCALSGAAGDARVVRRDDEPAAAGDRQNPGGHSASSALT